MWLRLNESKKLEIKIENNYDKNKNTQWQEEKKTQLVTKQLGNLKTMILWWILRKCGSSSFYLLVLLPHRIVYSEGINNIMNWWAIMEIDEKIRKREKLKKIKRRKKGWLHMLYTWNCIVVYMNSRYGGEECIALSAWVAPSSRLEINMGRIL